MDDKVANEIIDLKRTPMDHYCIIKKSVLESKCNRNITLKNGQIILDLKNN
jgi:hypothetical protein